MSETLAKAHQIVDGLKTLGERPVWCEVIDDGRRIAIGFEIISKSPGWTKALHYEAAHATPQAVQQAINEWRKEKQKQIAIGLPSGVVQNAIRHFGIQAVWKALTEK